MNFKKTAQLTGHNAGIYALCNGFEDDHFFSAGGDGWIVRWDFSNPDLGKLMAKVDVQIFSMCLLENERSIVVGNMNGGVHWVNMDSPEDTKGVQAHEKGVFDIVAFGDSVFTVGGGGRLIRWSRNSATTIETLHLSNQSLRCIAVCESRNEIAIGASDHSIYLLDANTLEIKEQIFNAHEHSVFSMKYHPNGNLLFSGGRDAHLNIWNLEGSVEKIAFKPAHWFTINSIAFSPDGSLFATGSRDKTLKIWDAQSFELLKVMEGGRDKGHKNSVNKLLWVKHNETLISSSDDRSIILWEIEK